MVDIYGSNDLLGVNDILRSVLRDMFVRLVEGRIRLFPREYSIGTIDTIDAVGSI